MREITNNPYQQLKMVELNDDSIGIVEKTKTNGDWQTKVIVLNKREALGIHQAISDYILRGGNNGHS